MTTTRVLDAPANLTYAEALAVVVARADWTTRREVIPAAAAPQRCSPNAMARNDWSPKDQVRFYVLVTLDGVDLTEDFAPDYFGRHNTKKEAQRSADSARSAMAEWNKQYCYDDGSYGGDTFETAIVGVGGPTRYAMRLR